MRNVRRIVVCLLGAVIAFSVGTAGAYFTDEVSVPDNVIRVGELELAATPETAAVCADALAPGETASSVLTVSNDGSLAADVIITGAKRAGYTDVYEALTCVVTHDGTKLYDGAYSELRTAPLRVAVGGEAAVRFDIGLPADADDGLQGDYVSTTLYLDAEQAH